jgi:uncharacterized membrane protein
MAFGMLAVVSLALGLTFVIVGAWPVLPWSLVEIVALGVAFGVLERRAGDYERLTVEGERVIVERVRAGRRVRREWNRRWLRVETAADGAGGPVRLLLHGAGPACEFGALLPEDVRGEVARRLRRITGH